MKINDYIWVKVDNEYQEARIVNLKKTIIAVTIGSENIEFELEEVKKWNTYTKRKNGARVTYGQSYRRNKKHPIPSPHYLADPMDET